MVGKKKILDDITVQARIPGELVKLMDDWRREQEDLPTRSEAIRRLLAKALKK